MAIELEAKMRVADLDAVRTRLRALRAVPRGRVLEVNTFFDTLEQTLLKRDSGLRLRHSIALPSGEEKHFVTFKGPQDHGELKRREEIEFAVADGTAATSLFERIGYVPQLSFEKRRETWQLGGCTIELDELPDLGTFVEIEGPDDVSVMGVRDAMGLTGEPLVTSGYASMVAAWLKQHPDRGPVLRF